MAADGAIRRAERDGLQALRAIACALVLIHHVSYNACEIRGLSCLPLLPVNLGRMGVDLFFVISGFVMGQCLGEGKAFILHRAARIFPPFWLAIVISFVVLGIGSHEWHADAWSALLLPSSALNDSYLIPYWTLCYEMAFYVATYVIILLKVPKSIVPVVCAAWIASIMIFNMQGATGGFDDDTANHFIFSPGWLILLSPATMLFAFGLMISTLPPLPRTLHPAWLAVVSLGTGTVALATNLASAAPNYLLLGIAYGAVMMAARRVTFPGFVVRLGDVSYGFYLVHVVAIVAVTPAIPHGADAPGFAIVWCCLAAASVALGITYGFLEYQIHSRFVRILFRRRSRSDDASTQASAPRPAVGN